MVLLLLYITVYTYIYIYLILLLLMDVFNKYNVIFSVSRHHCVLLTLVILLSPQNHEITYYKRPSSQKLSIFVGALGF